MKKRKRYIVKDEIVKEVIASVEKMKKQKLKPMNKEKLNKFFESNKR